MRVAAVIERSRQTSFETAGTQTGSPYVSWLKFGPLFWFWEAADQKLWVMQDSNSIHFYLFNGGGGLFVFH